MSAKFSLSHFIGVFYGGLFDGTLKLWSRKTKKTNSYGSDNIGEFAADVERRKYAEDLYVGLSTQPADLSETARGSNDTAMMLPGMVADIDFANAKDGNKRYPPNADTALSLIQSFDYKPLLIQNTGNGLHVLFKLDRPLVMQNREARRRGQVILRRFARKLARHFEQAGYEIDNVSDLARVYRVPGTYNHKSVEPKPVVVLEYNPENRLSLDELERDLPSVDEAPAKSVAPGTADHSAIQQDCAWYRHYTSDGAATADEPNWYAGASITGRCKDGDRIFHEYSRTHPRYDHGEAAAKLKRAREEAGPRTCESIANDLGQMRFCEACPHFQIITSPIQLGRVYDPGLFGPRPLGFTKDGLFALLDPVRKIVVLASAQQLLSEQYLLGLSESKFWLRQFPHEKRSVSFKMAGEALLKACLRAGPFNPARIRGRGAWLEDGKVVINLGANIESSKHLYLCFEPIHLGGSGTFDAHRLKDHLERYKWRNPLDAGLLFGWLAMAPVCGALAWRPHAFIWGPARSGKTTIHTVASIVLSPLAISADGQSSEAGIRQTLGPDSLPILLDEFESDQSGSTLRNVLRLARSAWSADTPVLKGTPEGKAMSFSLRTTFLFGAINPRGMSPADQSRISMFELLMHDNDREVAKRIAQDEAYFRTTGSAWCAHMIGLAHLVQPAADALDVHLTGDRRHRLNMSILIGAGFVALNSRVPTDDEAQALATEYLPAIEGHALEAYRDDAQECLDHLLSHIVDNYPIGHWLACLRDKQQGRRNDFADAERIIASYGMKVVTNEDEQGFYVANGAPLIEEAFKGTPWEKRAWQSALRKLDGATTPKDPVPFKMMGKVRGLRIPLSYLPDEPLPSPGNGSF